MQNCPFESSGYNRTHGYGPTHPAAEALAKIGKPASKEALNHLDGDAEDWEDDPADHQYPVCYESGTNLKVTVLFLADPEEDFEDATIEGDGPEGLDFSAEAADFVTINGKDYARVEFESSAAFPEFTVDWLPAMEVTWTLRSQGRVLVEKSVNEMFVTLVAPQCDTLYRTVAYLACSNTGAEDEDVALAHTWEMFSTGDDEPADVCSYNEQSRLYDRKLYYWHEWPDAESASTTGALLRHTNGNCDGWSHLFGDCLLVNGVSSHHVIVWPWNHVLYQEDKYRLVVNYVLWDEQNPAYPNEPIWKFGYSDINQSPSGLPGQNTPTPAQKVFQWHWITEMTYLVEVEGQQQEQSTYYDPSYGAKYESEEDFTDRAIAGWGMWKDGALHFAEVTPKGQRPPGEKVTFNRRSWEE